MKISKEKKAKIKQLKATIKSQETHLEKSRLRLQILSDPDIDGFSYKKIYYSKITLAKILKYFEKNYRESMDYREVLKYAEIPQKGVWATFIGAVQFHKRISSKRVLSILNKLEFLPARIEHLMYRYPTVLYGTTVALGTKIITNSGNFYPGVCSFETSEQDVGGSDSSTSTYLDSFPENSLFEAGTCFLIIGAEEQIRSKKQRIAFINSPKIVKLRYW